MSAEFLPYVIAIGAIDGQRIARFASSVDANTWTCGYSRDRCIAPLYVIDTSVPKGKVTARWYRGKLVERVS